MHHIHGKGFCRKPLSFGNKLSFDAGNTYNKSAGIWKHGLKSYYESQKNTPCQIFFLKKIKALVVELKYLLHVRF